MAGVALAGIFAVSLGTGYQASKPLLTDGSAWLTKGRTLAHVNAAAGRAEAAVEPELARDLAEDGSTAFETAAMPDGTLVVVNRDTNEVSTVDPGTMQATTSPPMAGEPGDIGVQAAGDQLYLVDAALGQVQLIDPVTRQPRGQGPVAVEKLAGTVVDGSGSLWVLDEAKRTLRRVRRGVPDAPVQLPSPGGRLRLTSVGGNPVVIDAGRQTVQRLVAATGILQDPVTLDGARPDRPLLANQPGAPGSMAWLVVPETGALVGADLDSRRSFSVTGIGPEGGSFEAPVVNGSRVFVVEASHHVVKVVDAGSRTVIDTFTVPGQSRRLEVFAKDGEVWLNDPLAREATIVGADGKRRRIDKGTGNGVREEQPQTPPETPPETRPEPLPDPTPQRQQTPRPPRGRPEAAAPSRPAAPPSSARPTPSATTPAAVTATPPPAAPARVSVPKVEGLAQAQACAKLQSAQLKCSPSPAPVHSAAVQAGVVVSQDPAAGSTQDPGAAVRVVVNPQPPPVTPAVPAVTGKPQASACQAIVAAGLTCTPVFGDDPGNNETNTVWKQSPAAGTRQAAGSAVTVTYTVKRIPLIQLRAINRNGVIMRIWYVTTSADYANTLVTKPVDGRPKYQYAGGDKNLSCYKDQGPGMVQLSHWAYDYGDGRHQQHFFGTKAPGASIWKSVGAVCWVFPSNPGTGARALYRMKETTPGGVDGDGRGRVQTFDPPPNAYASYNFQNDETWWVGP